MSSVRVALALRARGVLQGVHACEEFICFLETCSCPSALPVQPSRTAIVVCHLAGYQAQIILEEVARRPGPQSGVRLGKFLVASKVGAADCLCVAQIAPHVKHLRLLSSTMQGDQLANDAWKRNSVKESEKIFNWTLLTADHQTQFLGFDLTDRTESIDHRYIINLTREFPRPPTGGTASRSCARWSRRQCFT